MAPVTQTPATPPPTPVTKPVRRKPGRTPLIPDVDWRTYTRLIRAFHGRCRLE